MTVDLTSTSLRAMEADAARFSAPFDISGASRARERAAALALRIADHIAPRVDSLDAPLVAVVGGSTGAGKSTLVNALVGQEISRSGAMRPTTRQPVLVHHPDDLAWFQGSRILPSLPRVTLQEESAEARDRGAAFGTALHLVASTAIPRSVAIVDAPDIDSVSDDNRALARQLLRAADLWIFVTTAHRYADAVPWDVLAQAAQSDITVSVIMNRIPQQAGVKEDLLVHLKQMLRERGIEAHSVVGIEERPLGEGELLADAEVERLRSWLTSLADDAEARSRIARKTLAGALQQGADDFAQLAAAAKDQEDEQARLAQLARSEFDAAREEIAQLTRDGALLRGEVLARWQDVVGAGEFFKGLQGWISRTRDRLGASLSGRSAPALAAESAIESGLVTVVTDQVAAARARSVRAWNSLEAGVSVLASTPGLESQLVRGDDAFKRRVEDQVRAWQKDVLQLVQAEGADRRTKARVLSLGVNVLGIALMVVVFASTAFIPTGLEVGVGAGTAVVGQKLLESIFGDEAVRRLAKRARESLDTRIDTLVKAEAAHFARALAAMPIEVPSDTLRAHEESMRALATHLASGAPLNILAGEPSAHPSALPLAHEADPEDQA